MLFDSFMKVAVMTVSHFCDGREGVKIILLREGWLMAVDRWLNSVSKPLISVRWPSISGERWEQVQGMLRSTFLKRGTFMVLFLNRCRYLKWIDVSLARDAYNAYSRRASGCQGLFFQCFQRVHWGRGNNNATPAGIGNRGEFDPDS